MPDPAYIRLPRSRRRVLGCLASLWLGPDHLLVIDKKIGSEEYKRFYFSDIQAFIIRRNNRRRTTGLLLGVPLGLFGLETFLWAFAWDDWVASVIFGILTFILLVLLVYNLAAGPTVQTYLQTAVQIEELPPLNRLGRAYKALDRLRPLVVAAQGQLTPAEIPERMFAAQAAEAAAAPPPAPAAPPVIES